MSTPLSFPLEDMRIHVPNGPALEQLPADAALWRRLATEDELRLLAVHAVRTAEDVHAGKWERHPNGDELLCLCSGRVDLVLDEPDGPRVIALEPLTGAIIPKGTWHRLMVVEPAVLVTMAIYKDTQLRAFDTTPHVSSSAWQDEVFPHTPLQELAPDLWTVRGEFPSSQLPRNMVVYRYGGNSLLLHSVVALDEPTMRHLEALGKPSIMVIPNWDHWAHIVAFKKRYPDITVLCPEALALACRAASRCRSHVRRILPSPRYSL